MFKLFSRKRKYNRTRQDFELERLLFLASAAQVTQRQKQRQGKTSQPDLQDQSPDPDATLMGAGRVVTA